MFYSLQFFSSLFFSLLWLWKNEKIRTESNVDTLLEYFYRIGKHFIPGPGPLTSSHLYHCMLHGFVGFNCYYYSLRYASLYVSAVGHVSQKVCLHNAFPFRQVCVLYILWSSYEYQHLAGYTKYSKKFVTLDAEKIINNAFVQYAVLLRTYYTLTFSWNMEHSSWKISNSYSSGTYIYTDREFPISSWNFACELSDHILIEDLLIKVSSGGDNATWVTWKMALTIAMPICAICVVVMVIYHVRMTRRRHGHFDDSQEAPDRPILGGVTIRDMLEMTTSGSGSGRSN